MIPWIFLAVSVFGSLFTLNAHLPQKRLGPLIIPSFFSGWLTAELALHHLAWQLAATVLFVFAGALGAWPGQVGFGICIASWAGLLAIVSSAYDADQVIDAALFAGLGNDYLDQIPESARRSLERSDRTPRHPLNPFAFARQGVRVVRDLPYVPDGGPRNRLDVYTSEEPRSGAPVLLQIHGGGWTIGNKYEQALPLMYHLASRGWICVSANYRLSPKATFPDHLIDIKRAIAWIREEIHEYGGDPDFLCVTGGSAGGHLTAMVGLTANDPEYQPGFENVDTRVSAAVPIYGVYDFTNHYRLQPGRGMDFFLARWVMKSKLSEARDDWRRASPLHRIHPDVPPFLIVHGSHDSLASVEEARHFAQSLTRTSKSPVVYAEIPGAQHAFEIFHSARTAALVRGVDHFLTWVHARDHEPA